MSDEGGVWRTIGGRRVFIKDGDDLITAMKRSGKFNNLKTEEYQEKDLFEKIKNFDMSKVSKDKWNAEEEFLARMSNYYKDKDSTLSEEEKIKRLNGVNVIAKNEDYLLYSSKNVSEHGQTDYVNYEIVTSHNNNSRITNPPDIYLRRDWKTGEIEGVEINWAAYGSVDTNQAKEFANKLQNAVDFSKEIEKKLKGKK